MRRSARTITRRREAHGLAQLVEQGPYFTDGVRLFRLAGTVSGSSGPKFVQLEDCRTLALADYTEEEIEVLGLAPISPRRPTEASLERPSVRAARDDQHGDRARAHER
jgi:hypothetical protein